MENLTPRTREEEFLRGAAEGGTDLIPLQDVRREAFLKRLSDPTYPRPEGTQTREEWFLDQAAGGGGGSITVEELDVTENGTYTAPAMTAYNPVNVDVPLPQNALLLKDIPSTPTAIATFADGAEMVMPSLTVGVEAWQEGSGDPSPENVRPIHGWDSVNISVAGKNLWGGEKLADDIVAKVPRATKDTTNKTVTYPASVIGGIVLFDKFKSNTQYSFYFSTESPFTNVKVVYTDGTQEIPVPNTIYTSTVNKTIKSVSGTYSSGITALKYEECGVFEGVITAQDFEPYNGQTYTTTLKDGQGNPLTCYGGTLSNVNGVQRLTAEANEESRKKLSSINWTYQEANGRFYGIAPANSKKPATNNELPQYFMCECYRPKSYNNYQDGDITITSTGSIFVKDSNYTDVTAWLNAVGDYYLVYELATPTTYDTQPTAVKSLEGVNNVFADSGEILEGEYLGGVS